MREKIKYIIILFVLLTLIYIQQVMITCAEEIEDEEPAVQGYECTIPERDGENGYYTATPEIEIIHKDENNITKYKLVSGEEILQEGELTLENAVVKIEGFKEGRNSLFIWMENTQGERLEDFSKEEELLIDRVIPEINAEASGGFQGWHKDDVRVNVEILDSGSQPQMLWCYVDGELVKTIEGNAGTFVVSKESTNEGGISLIIEAIDKAGNKNQIEKKLYIDKQMPDIDIKGIQEYMITSEDVRFSFYAEDENSIASVKTEIIKTDENGNTINLGVTDWKEEQKLLEDGCYQIILEAMDPAGNMSKKKLQIIIDKTNPVIRYVDHLHQQYIRSFVWTRPHQEFIWDFTTYTYEMRLNGKLYYSGEKIQTEGRYLLEVKAKDEAGNESTVKASFVIDRTAPEIYFKNVEEGKTYEEKLSFQTGVISGEDSIEEIQINGKKQEIPHGKNVYECTLQEPAEYEVMVKAVDKAGNRSEERIYFSLMPKDTVVEKAIKIKERIPKRETVSIKQEKMPVLLWGFLAGFGIIIVAGGVVWWRKTRAELEETEDEKF